MNGRLAIALLIACAPAVAEAQSMSLTKPGQPARCDTLEMTADEMACNRQVCELQGGVHLACEKLDLWADELDIALGPDNSFAGAVARGNVLLVERNTVLTCTRLTLAEDRVEGKVDAATFRIKRTPVRRDERGVPIGRDQVVFRGDFERHDAETLHVRDASFTMCDCGEDPPSWILEANEIDATLGERATLWWPQPKFNAFGLGMVPGPPLFPISLALGDRATGMLPPEVKFLGGGFWPTIDLPVFVPIGRSWDVTVTPGMRFDWGTHRLTPISTWGAPRLDARVRYAPHASTSGEIRVGWTSDPKHRSAWQFAEKHDLPANQRDLDETLEDNPITDPLAQLLGRQALGNRVSVEIDHRTDFSDELTWLVSAEWLSDDLMTSDFRVNLEDRVANYMPSRTQLAWRSPGLAGTLAADHMLALGNSSRPGVTPVEYDYSNVGGREAGVAHRGPDVRLTLLPVRLVAGLHADADLSFVRYGPWTAARAPDRVIGGGAAGIAWLDSLGPVSLRAAARLDALWLDPTAADSELHAAAILDGSASLRLAGARGNLVHVVEPRLAYRGLPWLSSNLSGTLDPRLERETLHQLAVELDQTWWRSQPRAPSRIGRLAISQPVDIESGELLQTRVRLDTAASNVNLSGWIDVDVPASFSIEEVGARAGTRWRWLSLGGEWARWTPRADRFRRSQYELAAAGPELDDAAWVHMVRGRVGVNAGRVSAGYNADYLLPVDAIDCTLPSDTPDRSSACRAANQRVAGFTRHVVTLAYRSPCDCWELGATVSIPAGAPEDFRAQVTVAVGGYRVGN